MRLAPAGSHTSVAGLGLEDSMYLGKVQSTDAEFYWYIEHLVSSAEHGIMIELIVLVLLLLWRYSPLGRSRLIVEVS
jgi:hypothetical protein